DGDTYTLTVSNAAASTGATAGGPTMVGARVGVADSLPVGLHAMRMSGPGWTCSLETVSCTRSGDAGVADGGADPPSWRAGAGDGDAGATLVNRVSLDAGSGGELNGANNVGSDSTAVAAAPDLTVSSVAAGPLRQGDDGLSGDTFTLSVRNDGFGPTSGT